MVRFVLDNATNKSSQINNVNGGDQVVTFTKNRQLNGTLNPCLLEVIVKDTLSVTISDTSAEHVNFEHGLSGHSRHCYSFQGLQVLELGMRHSKMIVWFLIEKYLLLFGFILIIFTFATLSILFGFLLFFFLFSFAFTFFSFTFFLAFGLLFFEFRRSIHPSHNTGEQN